MRVRCGYTRIIGVVCCCLLGGEHDSREQEPLSLPLQQGIVVSRDTLVDTAMLLATVAAVLIVILLSHVHLMCAHRVERQRQLGSS